MSVGFGRFSLLWAAKKKRPKKNESAFPFRFLGATEKPTKKSRFSIENNRQRTTFGFRFTTPVADALVIIFFVPLRL